MAGNPTIFALANPNPEIMPELAHAARPDVIMATGRSDYPNQVNNALCFPHIFRGALDVGATIVNEEMKIACVHAIATYYGTYWRFPYPKPIRIPKASNLVVNILFQDHLSQISS